MVKKTKRFKYEAKKSAKEYVVRDEPKPEPTPSNPILDKKRIIMIAAGAAGILVLVVAAILFSQTSLTLDPAPESDTLNVPRPEGETLVDLSSPQVIFKLYGKTSDKIVNNTYSRIYSTRDMQYYLQRMPHYIVYYFRCDTVFTFG